jgi:hypothetical protein
MLIGGDGSSGTQNQHGGDGSSGTFARSRNN